MFELTEEQRKEIIELYGGSTYIIYKIEQELNNFEIIQNQEDYIEIIESVVAQFETIKLNMSFAKKQDKLEKFMSLDEIIYTELNRKYDIFEQENCQLKKILTNKKRHF